MSNPQRVELRHGDCIELMRELPDNSIDSIVTDPPYGLEFMGKEWDAPWKFGKVEWADEGTDKSHPFRDGSARVEYGIGGTASLGFQAWFTEVATEALRVLKPGGHLLAFGGTRTYHRLAVAIEDAGFEIRDSMIWLYGSGFPKSHDVSKAIDKMQGAKRQKKLVQAANPKVTGRGKSGDLSASRPFIEKALRENAGWHAVDDDTPISSNAKQWQGWGTALKPAHEPIVVARKPLIGTVAENVLEWGVGAMNIDGCRISGNVPSKPQPLIRPNGKDSGHALGSGVGRNNQMSSALNGRWPANVVLSHTIFCDDTCAEGCPVAELDRQSGIRPAGAFPEKSNVVTGKHYEGGWGVVNNGTRRITDVGGASRFFYVAKASKRERPKVDGVAHPTVKPLALMRWLVRLVTPPNGTVLEPFAGSGTTVEAALLEGFSVLAFEKTADYLPLIRERIRRTDTGVTN